jgi:hypothetical protein
MDEVFPVLLLVAAAVLTARYLFARPDPAEPQEVDAEELRRLQVMFPSLPQRLIREELARAGSAAACVDRLLQVSERMGTVALPLAQSPPAFTGQTATEQDVYVDPKTVDRSAWERDSSLRQSLLKSRKAIMLKQARERLLLAKKK